MIACHHAVHGYDPLNRTSVNDNGVVTGFTPNALNQYTSAAGQTPTYDSNFNLTSYAGVTYTYDADGLLLSASAPGYTMTCVYDGLGRCLKRTVNTAVGIFTYDGWKLIFEWDGKDNTLGWNMYGPGADELLWRWQPGAGYLHYHYDSHGNVMFLLDQNGLLAERYTYDAFGNVVIMAGDGTVRSQSAYGNRFMFQGREWFPQFGIYDYRHRVYHPVLGRFLQRDPLGFDAGDMNVFRYCGDDPVDRSDPTGMLVSEGSAERYPSQSGGVIDIDNAAGLHGGSQTNADTGTSMTTSKSFTRSGNRH